jgi:hypothetical protein
VPVRLYGAIRNSPAWDTSLLIITYDEHGGFYDSAPPPAATPPDDRLNYPAPLTLRAAIDPQTAQASLSEPIPDSGSLPGFLQILLKTDLELSTTPQERDEAQARHAVVTTRADARSYINYVMAKAHATKIAIPAPAH